MARIRARPTPAVSPPRLVRGFRHAWRRDGRAPRLRADVAERGPKPARRRPHDPGRCLHPDRTARRRWHVQPGRLGRRHARGSSRRGPDRGGGEPPHAAHGPRQRDPAGPDRRAGRGRRAGDRVHASVDRPRRSPNRPLCRAARSAMEQRSRSASGGSRTRCCASSRSAEGCAFTPTCSPTRSSTSSIGTSSPARSSVRSQWGRGACTTTSTPTPRRRSSRSSAYATRPGWRICPASSRSPRPSRSTCPARCAPSGWTGTLYGGVATQPDFHRAAALSKGGKPIVCLTSTFADGSSAIRPTLEARRADRHRPRRRPLGGHRVRHGILHGRSLAERALALIDIAHPEHRDALLAVAAERGLVRNPEKVRGRVAYPVGEERPEILRDGREVVIRPTRATDATLMQDLFFRLDDDDVRTRFFRRLRSLTDEMALHLVSVGYEREMAFAAVVGERESERIVGSSCYYLDPATGLADVAYMVDPGLAADRPRIAAPGAHDRVRPAPRRTGLHRRRARRECPHADRLPAFGAADGIPDGLGGVRDHHALRLSLQRRRCGWQDDRSGQDWPMVLCSPAIGVPRVPSNRRCPHVPSPSKPRRGARLPFSPCSPDRERHSRPPLSPRSISRSHPRRPSRHGRPADRLSVNVANSGGNTLNHVTVTGQIVPALQVSCRTPTVPMPPAAATVARCDFDQIGPTARRPRSRSTTPQAPG